MPVVILAMLLQSVSNSGLRDGLLALNGGDLITAQSALESASKQEPANAIVWAALAQVYLKAGRKEAALTAAQQAEQLAPENPVIQHALAMFYTGAGDPRTAAGHERQFAESKQADGEAYLRAASLYLQAGDAAHAIETAQAGNRQQERPALHHLLGLAYSAEKKPARALDELRAAVRLAPAEEEFAFDLAQALFHTEGFAEAAAALETSAQNNRPGTQTQLALGVAYYGLRRFPEAVDAFLKTIGLSPDLEQPYVFLSKMLDQAGEALPKIELRFGQFRQKHPDGYLGSFLAAKMLSFQGGTPELLEPLLQETIARNGQLWEPHSDLADLLSRKRNFAGAAVELERAAKLNSSEPSIPFRLARIYDRLNRPDQAASQRALHKEHIGAAENRHGERTALIYRRTLLGAAAAFAFHPRTHAAAPFAETSSVLYPVKMRSDPPYAPLLKLALPGADEFPAEKAAMELEAELRNKLLAGALLVAPELVLYRSAAPDLSIAQFGSEGEPWLTSLGNLQAARFFVLPGDRVRYEIKSGHGGKLQYRVGQARLHWLNGKLRHLELAEETLTTADRPWFRDVSAGLFHECPSFREQLCRGIPYWRARLDPATGIDLYGSNGISAADLDNDGRDEIYVCQPGGLPNRLYKNLGGGRFEDISQASGLDLLDDTSCALFLDWRNTGVQDAIVLRGAGPLLFLNDGKGRFEARPDAFRFAESPKGSFTGMAAADYDRDGKLDLYLCTYSFFQSEAQYRYPAPYHNARNGPPNFLFRNRLGHDGAGYFEDATRASGMNQNNTQFSFAPAWCDTTGSGWPDLYVANDFGRNNFYRNRNGRFADRAREAAVEDLGPGMSAAWFDYDADGRPDLYVSNMWSAAGARLVHEKQFAPAQAAPDAYRRHTKGNSLYRNQGDGNFTDTGAEQNVEMGRWAWSSGGFDFDGDGRPGDLHHLRHVDQHLAR